MSIKLLDRCWHYSQNKGGNLLVLLGIADFSNDEGIAYPSIATLARKARLTPRNTQRAIRRLVACGELAVEEGGGPHRAHLYRIVLPEGTKAEGCQNVRMTKRQDDTCDNGRVTFQPYKPSEETVIRKERMVGDKKSPSDTPPAVHSEFEDFWKLYPMRNGKRLEKPEAMRKFRSLKPEDRRFVLVAVQHYANSELVLKNMGIKDPHRWLRNGKGHEPWRDWIEPEHRATKNLQNGHGSSLACRKRVQCDRFLQDCGQPASPQSRPTEPRCAEHLRETNQPQKVTNAHN